MDGGREVERGWKGRDREGGREVGREGEKERRGEFVC